MPRRALGVPFNGKNVVTLAAFSVAFGIGSRDNESGIIASLRVEDRSCHGTMSFDAGESRA